MATIKYAIYGTGVYSKRFVEHNLNGGGGIHCFVESVPHAESFKGKKIIPPSEIPSDIDLIIVISSYIEDIKKTLKSANIDINKCVFSYNGRDFESPSDESVTNLLAVVKKKDTVDVRIEKSPYDRYSLIKTDDGLYFAGMNKDDMLEGMRDTGRTCSFGQIEAFFELCNKFYPEEKGKTILDCGCNILTTSSYVLKKRADFKSLAFEPNPDAFEMASLNSKLNDIKERVTLVNAALSNKHSIMKFRKLGYASGSGYLVSNPGSDDLTSTVDVQCYSLDEWCHTNSFDADDIGYLWIDVQGHEGFLLDGARLVLKKQPPLFVEFCTNLLEDTGCKDLCISILKEFYDEYVIVNWDGSYDLSQIQPVSNLVSSSLWTNIFMIRKRV